MRFGITLVGGLWALTGCSNDERDPVRRVFSEQPATILQEGASARLARPSAVAQAPNGDLIVSDRLLGQAFRFTRHGRLLNTIGHKGSGPGEFQAPRAFAFLGDSVLVAMDPGLHRAQRFSLGGTPIGLPIDLPFDASVPTAANGFVWFGGSSLQDNFSLLRWDPRSEMAARFLAVPQAYRESPLLLLLGGAVVAPSADNLIVGFGPSSTLLLLDAKNGAILDSIMIPVARRRGLSDGAVKAAQAGNGFAVLDSASSLSNIGQLSSGGLAVVFRDLTRTRVDFTSKLYMTTIDRRGHPRCVDRPLAQLDATLPVMNFVGDTLLVLEQLLGQGDTVQTVIRRLVVNDSTAC